SDDPISQRQSSSDQKPHHHGHGMPAACGEAAEHSVLRCRLIKMKGLRIEFCREGFDSLFLHPIGGGGELLADVQIFQVETLFMVHRSIPALASRNKNDFPE